MPTCEIAPGVDAELKVHQAVQSSKGAALVKCPTPTSYPRLAKQKSADAGVVQASLESGTGFTFDRDGYLGAI